MGLRTAGTLVVGFDADDVRELDRLHAFQQELGLAAQRLTASACREREPALTPRLRGGVHVAGDHSVDARALHAALLAAARSAGVELLPARVTGLRRAGASVTGLSTVDGTVAAGTVVLALGARSATLPGCPPPCRYAR